MMHFLLVMVLLAFWLSHAASGSVERVLTIEAEDLFSAGQQQGRWAKERIQAWIGGEEMTRRIGLINNNETYATLFAGLKRDNAKAFPELAEELVHFLNLRNKGGSAGKPCEWTGSICRCE